MQIEIRICYFKYQRKQIVQAHSFLFYLINFVFLLFGPKGSWCNIQSDFLFHLDKTIQACVSKFLIISDRKVSVSCYVQLNKLHNFFLLKCVHFPCENHFYFSLNCKHWVSLLDLKVNLSYWCCRFTTLMFILTRKNRKSLLKSYPFKGCVQTTKTFKQVEYFTTTTIKRIKIEQGESRERERERMRDLELNIFSSVIYMTFEVSVYTYALEW